MCNTVRFSRRHLLLRILKFQVLDEAVTLTGWDAYTNESEASLHQA